MDFHVLESEFIQTRPIYGSVYSQFFSMFIVPIWPGWLEIGENYVCCGQGIQRLGQCGERHRVVANLRISADLDDLHHVERLMPYRDERLRHQSREDNGQKSIESVGGHPVIPPLLRGENESHHDDQKAVGSVSFHAEREDDIGGGSPATLAHKLVVDQKIFDEMLKLFMNNVFIERVNLDYADLEYSYEPDGSHRIWKIDSEDKLPQLPLLGYGLNWAFFRRTEDAIENCELDPRWQKTR